jgi:hypothetical protein
MSLNKGIPVITTQRTVWNAAVDVERHLRGYAGVGAADGDLYPSLQ